MYIYIGIVRNQTLGKRSTKWLLGGGNAPLGAPSRVQLQMLDFLGFCWIVPLKGFFFLQNLAKNAGFSRDFLQTLSKNAGFARIFCMVHPKMLDFPGFFLQRVLLHAVFTIEVDSHRSLACLRERRAAWRSEGLVQIHNWNRLPSQPSLFEGAKDCLKERKTSPNSQ